MGENRLGRETSPYLLQHKDNPVHWWAWGPEALAEARSTGKPILLSVGYAACHWCHVMAHESFEDEATAAVMNEHFVNIKVDREERPDIDAIYMGALHRLGQQGGWPLTMFLDSQARPFWGGTYFPPAAQWGRPAFVDVLRQVARVYEAEPAKVDSNATALIEALSQRHDPGAGAAVTETLLADLTQRMVGAVDTVHGGLSGAPKFPQWSFFWLLWRGAIRYGNSAAQTAVETTLKNICQGGIYDHLAGGFARYSVDERWLVPHFEKMLYDNALLIDLLTEVWRETHNPLFQTRVEETVAWLEREMIAEGGAFAASLDADSEGEEGKFSVWTRSEIETVLGDDAAFFCQVYDVSEAGNWEGHTILNRLLSGLDLRSADEERRLAVLRHRLLSARGMRVRPGWDDKVLADWNGLMIGALARAAVVFDQPAWLERAQGAFRFVTARMAHNGRLRHSYRNGQAKAPATASDYANLIWAAVRLFEATREVTYLDAARGWVGVLDRHYWAEEANAYATTADDTDDVIVRLIGGADDAVPNANGMMVGNLAALGLLTGELAYTRRGERIVAGLSGEIARSPVGCATLLASAFDLMAPQYVVICGCGPTRSCQLSSVLKRLSLPGVVTLAIPASGLTGLPILAGKVPVDGRATAYVCVGQTCMPPVTEPTELETTVRKQRRFSHVGGASVTAGSAGN